MKFIKELLLALIPRFITDECAVAEEADGYAIVCSVDDVQDGERFDGVISLNIFTWLGFAFPVGANNPEVKPWLVSEA